jgi:hypothetical protein
MASIAASAAVRSKPVSVSARASASAAMDGARRRALAAEHQRGLAGEGGGDHAGHAVAVALAAMRLQAEFLQDEAQDRALAAAGVAEDPGDQLLLGLVLEPVHDALHPGPLLVGERDVAHGAAPRWAQVRPLAMA